MSAIELVERCEALRRGAAVDDVVSPSDEGEFTTILGPSGSGKTTLLNRHRRAHRAHRAGASASAAATSPMLPAAQRNVGLVFQSYALFPHMSVFDNIAFPLEVRGAVARRDRAAAWRRRCAWCG